MDNRAAISNYHLDLITNVFFTRSSSTISTEGAVISEGYSVSINDCKEVLSPDTAVFRNRFRDALQRYIIQHYELLELPEVYLHMYPNAFNELIVFDCVCVLDEERDALAVARQYKSSYINDLSMGTRILTYPNLESED